MPPKKTPTETISFRLDADVLRLLDQQRQPYGSSRGEWVRGAVTNMLDGNVASHSHEIEHIAEKLDETFTRLEDQLAITLYIILVSVGGIPADQAKETVRNALVDGRG